MVQKTRILIVDDEPAIGDILAASLGDEGYETQVARDGRSGLDKLKSFQPEVVLLDIWMPGDLDGLDVLKEGKTYSSSTQFIIMSGHGTIETAVRAVKLGAWDFVEKPLSMDKINILIQNILAFRAEQTEKKTLINRLRKSIAMVGESQPIKDLRQMISRVAPTSSWVLITGENGTGKELVAQNIHYLSPRAGKPLVEVNCAAIPTELVESELFGYEKGAFTGADRRKVGKFDLAHGGTIFLDEIGDMSLPAQSKVLRILQDKVFQRVGGNENVSVDVRVIAATNKNLVEEIKAGRFREDLYYRLNVIPFVVPPLRERPADIPLLVQHFGEQFARDGGYVPKTFSEQAMKALQGYSWPGNVRELRNFIERIYILTPGDFVDLHDLRFAGLNELSQDHSEFDMMNFREARAKFEQEFLLKKIQGNQGNISRTAEQIGLERSYLHRKIKYYGIDV